MFSRFYNNDDSHFVTMTLSLFHQLEVLKEITSVMLHTIYIQ